MRYIALLFGITACGPLGDPGRSIGVSMDNEYAESIFTVDVVQQAPTGVTLKVEKGPIETGISKRLMNMERIKGFTTGSHDSVMIANEEAELAFTVTAISIGETHPFTGTFKVSDSTYSKNALGFTYDYDIALAQFSLKFSWR